LNKKAFTSINRLELYDASEFFDLPEVENPPGGTAANQNHQSAKLDTFNTSKKCGVLNIMYCERSFTGRRLPPSEKHIFSMLSAPLAQRAVNNMLLVAALLCCVSVLSKIIWRVISE